MLIDRTGDKMPGIQAAGEAIDSAMEHDGQKTLLESLRIRPDDKLERPQVAWSMINTIKEGSSILGTLGNFSLIIGRAKAKKSFFINIAVSTATSRDIILGRFKSDLSPRQDQVLYFDTEQSKYHVWQALDRICLQIGISEPENLYVYGLRSKTPAERRDIINYAIENNDRVGFVVIDGIKDLVTSINDEDQATGIASDLLRWTEERNIHIVAVLHQNKGDNNARGHIGTELINKAETVLQVTKCETDSDISIVEPQQCRNIEPESFAFRINERGLPELVDYEPKQTRPINSRANVLNIEDHKKYQLLTQVFGNGKEFIYKELERQLQVAYEATFGNSIGINKVGALIVDFKNKKWLLQERIKGPYTLGEYKSTIQELSL